MISRFRDDNDGKAQPVFSFILDPVTPNSIYPRYQLSVQLGGWKNANPTLIAECARLRTAAHAIESIRRDLIGQYNLVENKLNGELDFQKLGPTLQGLAYAYIHNEPPYKKIFQA